MPYSLLVVAVVVGVAALAGLLVMLAVRSGQRWRKALDTATLAVGFQPCPAGTDPGGLAQRLRLANPRHRGERQILHLYQRPCGTGEAAMYVCDYRFASAGGRTSGGGWILVCLVANDLDLPRVSVDGIGPASGLGGRLAQAMAAALEVPGMRRVPGGSAERDRRFHVLAQDPAACATLLPRLLAALEAAPIAASVDAGGDTLILSSVAMMADQVRHVIDAGKLRDLVTLAGTLGASLRRS